MILLKKIILLLLIFGGIAVAGVSLGVDNPAATYCENLGYNLVIEKTKDGGEVGVCKFPDGSTAGDWAFLKGQSSQKWSYCQQRGFELKVLSNSLECHSVYSIDCSVCVLANGVEIEASKLLKAEKATPGCGNKICDLPKESFNNCPQDCPSGGRDGFCDGLKDKICDPDCLKAGDPDCSSKVTWVYGIIAFIIIISLSIIVYKVIKNRKIKNKNNINND